MGARLAGGERVLWVAHRRELVEQAAIKLEQMVGTGNVNRVMPGVIGQRRFPDARVQVGTVQTLLRRERVKGVELVVLDEAHRYAAEEYRTLADAYPEARLLGLTATPERHDGKPLGDIFDHLIVAAQHSELIAGEYIMPLRVVAPIVDLWRSGDDGESYLAVSPVEAYRLYSNGGRAFVFGPNVERAEEWAREFRGFGVRAGCVEGRTPNRFRARALGMFGKGDTRVLTSVFTLNEGLDVPEAEVAILGRAFLFEGSFLQSVGRIARKAEGKSVATVVDLTGATIRHGSPNQDREYSLTGRAITHRGERCEFVLKERREMTVKPESLVVTEGGTMPLEWAPTPLELKRRARAERDHQEAETVFRKHGQRHADFFARYQARINGVSQ